TDDLYSSCALFLRLDHAEHLSRLQDVARIGAPLDQHTVGGRRDVEGSAIRQNLDEPIALEDEVALPGVPDAHRYLPVLRQSQLRQDDRRAHGPAPSRRRGSSTARTVPRPPA